MFLGIVTDVYRKFKGSLKRDENFVLWCSLALYTLVFFSVNNKTLLILFLVFLFIFYRRLKSFPLALFIIFLLFLPFHKGKSFDFTLLPSWKIEADRPYTFGYAITFSDLAFLLLFYWFLRSEMLKIRIGRSLQFLKGDFFLLAFMVSVFISVLLSPISLVSFLAYVKIVEAIAIYFLMRKLFREKKVARYFPIAFVASASFQAIWSALQFSLKRPLGKSIEPITGRFSVYGHAAIEDLSFFRAQGTFDHPNTLGVFSTILFCYFLVVCFTPGMSAFYKKIYLTGLVASFLSLLLSASRVSWGVGFVFIPLVIIFFRFKGLSISPYMKRLLKVITILSVLFLPVLILPRLSHLYQTFTLGGGFSYRTALMRMGFTLARTQPLGIGLVNFPVAIVNIFHFQSWPAPIHNLLMEILVETGVLSLLLFLLFLIYSYRSYVNMISERIPRSEYFMKTGGLFASLGFFILANFYPFLWSSNIFAYFWLFLASMLY